MLAEELRIGNYFLDEENKVRLVTELSRALIRTSFDLILLASEVKPIPLTEEVLLKCGFEKEGDFEYVFFGEITNYILDEDTTGTYQVGVNQGCCTNFFSWDIKYLHQLQNLFYAITGKELEVSL